MKKIKKYIPTTLAIIAIFLVIRYEIANLTSNEWFIFDFIDTIIWYGLGLLIAVPTIIYSVRQLKKKKTKIHYLPLVIICIGALTIIGLLTFGKIENKSLIIFTAYYDGDTDGIHIDLRQDGTYHLENYSVLGGEFFEGTYKIKGDTILLDNTKPLGDNTMTNKLIIKADTVLFSLDKNGNYKTDYFTMRIKNNKLKK
jgi:hypothetical protein